METWSGFSKTARAILTYLLAHPNASDTIEGIEQWWLKEEPPSESRKIVQGALQRLVELGYLRTRLGLDGQIHFRLISSKRPEIEALLKNKGMTG